MSKDKQALLKELEESYPAVYEAIEESGGKCWTTDEVTEAFEITGFIAPFCTAVHRETGEKGFLTFFHMPRVYYNWRLA